MDLIHTGNGRFKPCSGRGHYTSHTPSRAESKEQNENEIQFRKDNGFKLEKKNA